MVHKEVEGSFRVAEFLLLWWGNKRPTKTSVSPSARILRMFRYTYQYRSPAQDDILGRLLASPPHPNPSVRSVRRVFSLDPVNNHERLCTICRTKSIKTKKELPRRKFFGGAEPFSKERFCKKALWRCGTFLERKVPQKTKTKQKLISLTTHHARRQGCHRTRLPRP